jgi:hypothetical protein
LFDPFEKSVLNQNGERFDNDWDGRSENGIPEGDEGLDDGKGAGGRVAPKRYFMIA